MTRLYINKHEVTPLPPDLTSLEQVVRLVEADHLSPDTVIRDIQIDGQSLADTAGEFHVPDRIDNRQTIEIFTSSILDVALDSIQEAIVYLERIEKATPLLAAGFRSDCGRSHFENLKEFYEGFYWVNLLLDRLERSFDIHLDELMLYGRSARQHHIELAALLKEVIGAHEKKDFGLIADLLEYELAPLVPAWKELFGEVRERVRQRA